MTTNDYGVQITKIEIIFDRDHGRENYGWYVRETDENGQEKDQPVCSEKWYNNPRVAESTIRAWAKTYIQQQP